MLSVLLWVIPRRFASLAGMRPALVACLAALAGAPLPAAADQSAAPLAASGVADGPADAAFLSSSLRIRDQYDRIVKSKAFAAVKQLPAVKRAIDSYEEQRTTPGSRVLDIRHVHAAAGERAGARPARRHGRDRHVRVWRAVVHSTFAAAGSQPWPYRQRLRRDRPRRGGRRRDGMRPVTSAQMPRPTRRRRMLDRRWPTIST